jgi:hypothetical protein
MLAGKRHNRQNMTAPRLARRCILKGGLRRPLPISGKLRKLLGRKVTDAVSLTFAKNLIARALD